ncbi:MAG: aspartate-semialdehyde dehydrogenase [Candidatus Aminicenantes bacterium]|nr:aspartate-semialdehyde dehydrogenase [Candidatus Aminicenantes bacterium]
MGVQAHKVAVLGSTGIVGQQFVRMLDSHPYFELEALCGSQKSRGVTYEESVKWAVEENLPDKSKDIVISEVKAADFIKKGISIVFSAVPAAIAMNFEHELSQKGLWVFSNSSAYRMEPDVPIIIPEVNPDHIKLVERQIFENKGLIITNANCTTTGLSLALKPLQKFGLQSVNVTTYQALSGAGRNGLPSLDIMGNIIPFIKEEEEKVERETQKILGTMKNGQIENPETEIFATCSRVPVRNGHLLSIVATLKKDVDLEEIAKTFQNFKGIPQAMKLPTAPEIPIIIRNESDRPQPLMDVMAGSPDRARGMAVSLGRMRKKGNKIRFFALVHNTIRGAAGTCILNAELACTMRSHLNEA